jgi:hypothetical protein
MGEEKCTQNLLENVSADGSIILKWMLKLGYQNVDWSELAQDTVKC